MVELICILIQLMLAYMFILVFACISSSTNGWKGERKEGWNDACMEEQSYGYHTRITSKHSVSMAIVSATAPCTNTVIFICIHIYLN